MLGRATRNQTVIKFETFKDEKIPHGKFVPNVDEGLVQPKLVHV